MLAAGLLMPWTCAVSWRREEAILPVILSEGEDGYIVAEVPVIPGCVSQGKTVEEALANIKEAAELCLESREAKRWALPHSYSME
jgi:predicted RNase H-like HicB family nuclease